MREPFLFGLIAEISFLFVCQFDPVPPAFMLYDLGREFTSSAPFLRRFLDRSSRIAATYFFFTVTPRELIRSRPRRIARLAVEIALTSPPVSTGRVPGFHFRNLESLRSTARG